MPGNMGELRMNSTELRNKLAAFAPVEENEHQWFLFNHEPDLLEQVKGLEPLGNLPRKSSREIARSPLGIGFETLDRDTFDPADTYAPLGASGVKFARCQTGWMKCEKEVGKFDFAWLDDIADNLLKQGIEPWFSLSFGHPVHTPCPEYEKMREEYKRLGKPLPGRPRGWVGECPYLHGPEAMAAWLRYVKAIAGHFRGRVRKWEVWNEPDANCFWQVRGVPDPGTQYEKAAKYTDFVRITGQTVREIIPDAEIVAVAAAFGSTYMQGLGAAGLADVIDIFSFHAYTPVPEEHIREKIDFIRANIRRSDGRPLRIIQGESGRASGKSAHFAFPTQLGQARFLARRYLTDFAHGMEMTSFFTVTDFLCYYADGSDQFYGILDARHKTPKLAYHTLCHMAWLFDGLENAPDNLATFRPESYFQVGSWMPFHAETAAFRRKGVPVFAVWIPEHVELSMPPAFGRLNCIAKEAMPHPVILDPIRGRAWDASGLRTSDPAANWRGGDEYMPFPATNAPLLVTDAGIFDEL